MPSVPASGPYRLLTRIARAAAGFLAAMVVLAGALALEPRAQTTGKFDLLGAPEAIYAPQPDDAWNRIFYFLFSRRMEARLSNEFPEGAPFERKPLFPSLVRGLRISKRTFERKETGDRAIDPLSPSFLTGAGRHAVLTEPGFSGLTRALRDALDENVPRTPVARALMQSDLWSAFDSLYVGEYNPPDPEAMRQRRTLLDLLGRMIRKSALTPGEVGSLPDNYVAAGARTSLPPLFGKDSGWIEALWFPHRTHDSAADFRRVARLFVRPAHPPGDVQQFLDSLRNRGEGVEVETWTAPR